MSNVDHPLAELASRYAGAAYAARALELDACESGDCFRFPAGEYTIEVFRVENLTDEKIDADVDPDDWYGWRIKDANGITIRENDDDDRAIFSESAVAEAWLIFSRLIRTNETDKSDFEAEDLFEKAYLAAKQADPPAPVPSL